MHAVSIIMFMQARAMGDLGIGNRGVSELGATSVAGTQYNGSSYLMPNASRTCIKLVGNGAILRHLQGEELYIIYC